jgi:hypothetical protein
MLRYKTVVRNCDEMRAIKNLYRSTFPEQEKVPFRHLLRTSAAAGR